MASLKSETMGKLINRMPGSRLMISSLPGSALRTLVESLGKPQCHQAFLKPCRVNFDFTVYVFTELANAGRPLFPGNDVEDQLKRIFKYP